MSAVYLKFNGTKRFKSLNDKDDDIKGGLLTDLIRDHSGWHQCFRGVPS